MVVADVGLFSFSSCIPSLSPPPPRLRFSFTRTRRLAVASMSDDPVREWILSEGKATQITGIRSIGGGCINRASRYDTDAGSFFVKTNRYRQPAIIELDNSLRFCIHVFVFSIKNDWTLHHLTLKIFQQY